MGRDCSPALFVTVDRLDRRAQELSKLLLCFFKYFAGAQKLFVIHVEASPELCQSKTVPMYHNVVYYINH